MERLFVYQTFEVLPCGEFYRLTGLDIDSCSRLRIAPLPGLPAAYRKSAKPNQPDLLILFYAIFNASQNRINSLFSASL